MQQEADGGTRAGMGLHHLAADRQHRLAPHQRLADDAGQKAGGRLVGFARPHADGRQAMPTPSRSRGAYSRPAAISTITFCVP
jgi:hypothetical protein